MTKSATEAEMATVFDKTDMPAWKLDDICLPSNKEWADLANPHVITLRLSAVFLTQAKPDLLEAVISLSQTPGGGRDRTALMEIVDQIMSTRRLLSGWDQMLSTAECRLMSAVAKALESGALDQ